MQKGIAGLLSNRAALLWNRSGVLWKLIRLLPVVLLSTSELSAGEKRVRTSGSAEFSSEERAMFLQGKSVKRRLELKRNGRRYHAGLSYRLIQARPMDVMRVLREPGGVARVLPYGISATAESEKAGVTKMRVRQGKPPVVGTYTVKLVWDLSKYEAKFWLDPSERSDIDDVWGLFQAREVSPGLTLISFGFAFDIGGLGSLLERKAQGWALDVPDRLADLLAKQSPSAGQFRKSP